MILSENITIPKLEISKFCNRWRITELALFGSVLRNDFSSESDLDFLATFAHEANWGLFDHMRMKDELAEIFQRDIDLFSREAIELNHNPYRRHEILDSAKIVYVEG